MSFSKWGIRLTSLILLSAAFFNPGWSAELHAADTPNAYIGSWEDLDTHTIYTIESADSQLRVTSAIDDDGEVFEIKSSTWDGKKLRWTCLVPSTDTTLRFETTSVNGDTLWCDWNNDSSSGSQEFRRAERPADPKTAQFLGTWEDTETHSLHTIILSNGTPTVSSVIDDDQEVYTVKSVRWDGTRLIWSYYVPSTRVTVKLQSTRIEGNLLYCSWDNGTSSGDQEFRKVPLPTASRTGTAALLEGTWEDLETQTLHTIELIEGEPTVTSIVDDDGEVFKIRRTEWDGSVLRWSCYVPSTRITLRFATTRVEGDTLWCSWSNNSTSGDQEFRRKKAGAQAVSGDMLSLLPGTWKDLESSTYYTIEERNGSLAMTSIIDHDGELFDIQDFDWNGSAFSWTCYVPSTKITLSFKTTSIDDDTLWCTWDNGKSSGNQEFRREAPPVAGQLIEILPGTWKDQDNLIQVVIIERNGKLTVASVRGPDGETYPVSRINWDGARLQWSYTVPSTGITVRMETKSALDDNLWCSWDDSQDSGTKKLTRQDSNL